METKGNKYQMERVSNRNFLKYITFRIYLV